jgi:hypothetical protein
MILHIPAFKARVNTASTLSHLWLVRQWDSIHLGKKEVEYEDEGFGDLKAGGTLRKV